MTTMMGARGLKPWSGPKRARARWLEGAPDYVCDVFDDGREADRYTVFFTGCEWVSEMNPRAPYLGLDAYGQSVWGELAPHEFAAYRYRNGKRRVRWLDLPEHVRQQVQARADES